MIIVKKKKTSHNLGFTVFFSNTFHLSLLSCVVQGVSVFPLLELKAQGSI